MELMKGRLEAGRTERPPARSGRFAFAAAALMAAGLAYFGTHYLSAGTNRETKQASAMLSNAKVAGGCDMVFTDRVTRELERRVESAVSPRSGEIKSSLGLDHGFLTFAIGVDRSGRPMIEDAWASGAGGEVDARAVVRALGLSFEGVTLAAPGEGTRCSYTLSSRI